MARFQARTDRAVLDIDRNSSISPDKHFVHQDKINIEPTSGTPLVDLDFDVGILRLASASHTEDVTGFPGPVMKACPSIAKTSSVASIAFFDGSRPPYAPASANNVALPPAAVVSMQTTRSWA